MQPILYTSTKAYNAAGPLPWLDGYTKKNKSAMLKIIKEGLKSNLSYQKISSNLHTEFPELKVKSKYPHTTYLSTEIVVTERRIRSELEKYSLALDKINKGWKVEKKWSAMPDENTCQTCRNNELAGWIPISDPFPSGHLYAPSHHSCRCHIQTRFEKIYVESGLPKDRWVVEREGDVVKVKPNPKYYE